LVVTYGHTVVALAVTVSSGHAFRSSALSGLVTAAGIAQQLTTTAAVLVGGGWAYLKFVRGRVYAPRAELTVTAEMYASPAGRMLVCRVDLANKGLTRLWLQPDGQVVRLHISQPSANSPAVVGEEKVGVVPVFTGHDWLEAQETISEDVRFQLAAGSAEWFRVEAEVRARRPRFRRYGQSWLASRTLPGSAWVPTRTGSE
jgi:hypothetical protein